VIAKNEVIIEWGEWSMLEEKVLVINWEILIAEILCCNLTQDSSIIEPD
jgi:hypothetical protein